VRKRFQKHKVGAKGARIHQQLKKFGQGKGSELADLLGREKR